MFDLLFKGEKVDDVVRYIDDITGRVRHGMYSSDGRHLNPLALMVRVRFSVMIQYDETGTYQHAYRRCSCKLVM